MNDNQRHGGCSALQKTWDEQFFFFFLPILIHERSLGVKVQIPKIAAVELLRWQVGLGAVHSGLESTRVPLYTFLCAMSVWKKAEC